MNKELEDWQNREMDLVEKHDDGMRETENRHQFACIGLPRIAIFLLWLAAASAAAFFAGMSCQAKRDLRASRDFDAWLERVEREAEANVQSMSNAELLQPVPPKETSR